ncbi:MAG: TonB-dependent receptor [Pseudomonadota bacterium]
MMPLFRARLVRTFFCAASAGALTITAAPVMAQSQSRQQVTIEAQSLDAALVELGRRYGVSIFAPGKLTKGKRAPKVSGNLTLKQAIDRVLAGSDLTARRSRDGGYVIVRTEAAAPSAAATATQTQAPLQRNIPTVIADAIVVTAQKREERLEDVPISLSVFDDEEILRSNFVTFEDYALRTPNVSFQNNGGAARTLFTIRGVGSGNIGSGTGTSVGLYMDEIILNPTGGLRQNDLALLDLERVEVLRGPQGTLYGRNTIGGAINLITRKPNDEEFSGRVTAGIERFDTYFAQGHINVPVFEGLAIQASGLYRDSDGFILNTTNSETLGSGAAGGRIAARITPSDDITIDLSAMRNEVTYSNLQSVPEDNFNAGRFEGPFPFQVENEVVTDLFTARIEANGPGFDVISLTAYNEFEAIETFDVTGQAGPFPAFAEFGISQENISQELRLQSNRPEDRLQWLVGVYYGRTDDANDTIAFLGVPDNPGPQLLNQTGTSHVDNIAIFANGDYRLSDQFTLSIGARYSWDDYQLISGQGNVFAGSNSAFTPKITLQYQPNPDFLFYATVSRGYRPGGIDTQFFDLDPTDDLTSQYDPETAWNYEIGANASFFNGRLTARANIFYLDYEDIQASFFVPPLFIETITTNGAAARIYGAELEMRAQPIDHVTLDFNIGLLDSEFTDFADSPDGDLTGNDLPFAPAVNLSAVAEYSPPITDDVSGLFRVEYTYRSDQEGRNDNNAIEFQPGYDLFNIRAGIATETFELVVYGENVFDEEYFTNRRGGVPITVVPGRPATWGVRGTVRF